MENEKLHEAEEDLFIEDTDELLDLEADDDDYWDEEAADDEEAEDAF